MLIQLLNIFGICSLYSIFLLMPVCLLYYLIRFVRCPHGQMYGYHKFILVISLAIPIILTSYLCTSHLDSSPGRVLLEDISTPIQLKILPPYSQGSFDRAYSIHQILWGISYYLVGCISLLISLGFITFVIRLFLQSLFLKKIQRTGNRLKNNTDYPAIVSEKIPLPFSAGVFDKQIFLPENIPSKEREIIIIHESLHLQQNHYAWSVLESFITHIFWFNPIMHFMRAQGILLREIECDSSSVKSIDKFRYSRALVDTSESFIHGRSPGLLVQPWHRKGVLKARLEHLLNPEKGKRRHLVSLIFYVFTALLVSGFVFVIHIDGAGLEKKILEQVRTTYESISRSGQPIASSRVPDHFFKILIYNEDQTFFTHNGISIKAFIRAGINNIIGKPLQGGSTLTQQLGKILTSLPNEKTLVRKLKQVKSAQVLEKNFSKAEILEMYINSVYFGQGAFGIEQAARTFFNHSAGNLTPAESAMLVQSLKQPKNYNPVTAPAVALERTEYLLNRMQSSGGMDKREYQLSLIHLKKRIKDLNRLSS